MQQVQSARKLGVDLMMPRFRWGSIAPTGGDAGPVRRAQGYQFYHVVPPDVMQISAGRGMEVELESGDFDKAEANYWEAVDLLSKEKVDAIMMSGVPVSANFGRARTLDLLKRTTEKTGIAADSSLEAMLASLEHLGAKTVAIGSRWADQLNQAVTQYLKDGGVEVLGITSRGQMPGTAGPIEFEEGLQMALDVGREAARLARNADAILVPGGRAMSLHVIPTLEDEFGKPVLTNLNAEVWHNLVRTQVVPPIEGWGKLLAAR
jgi:maleate cis-trans isomerase